MKKYLIIGAVTTAILIGGIILFNVFASNKGNVPSEGFVPNRETAIKIAEVIWASIYGETIYDKKPFVAEYNEKEGCWEVRGTLSQNMRGGIPEIKINKSDGKILYVNHGK